jgi:hypothetical protein
MRFASFCLSLVLGLSTLASGCASEASSGPMQTQSVDDASSVEDSAPDGGTPLSPRDIAPLKGFLRGVAADAENVYFADDAELSRVDLATGTRTTLGTGLTGGIAGLRLIDGALYATDASAIVKIPLDGGAPRVLTRVTKIKGNQGPAEWWLGANATSFFAYDDVALLRFPREGSGTSTRTRVSEFFYLFPAGKTLWLVSHWDDFTIRVVSADNPSSTLSTFYMQDTSNSNREVGEVLAANASFVFSSEIKSTESTLIRYENPATPGPRTRKVLGKLAGRATAMTADETHVFVQTYNAVHRYSVDGTEERELSKGVFSGPMTVNGEYLFVHDSTSSPGVLRALPRAE